MKKIGLLVCLLTIVFSMCSCVNKTDKMYAKLKDFIITNGIETDEDYTLSLKNEDLYSFESSQEGAISLILKSDGMLEIIDANSSITTRINYYHSEESYYVVAEYMNDDGESDISTGYITKNFCKESPVIEKFTATNQAFGVKNAKAVMASAINLALSRTNLLLKNMNAGVSLSDIGFTNYK